MSQDVASKRKQKKVERDAARFQKPRKRKRETEALPGDAQDEDDEQDEVAPPKNAGAVKIAKSTATVPDQNAKKRKREEDDTTQPKTSADTAAGEDGTDEPPTRKKKRQRGKKGKGLAVDGSERKHRFILFIGNLPYNTTDASLQAYFDKLSPFTLRHRTDPQTKKSKGFAFLEFESYDRMETCLKKYHHSLFDPDEYSENAGRFPPPPQRKGKKEVGRRINVELTAGGGGAGEVRKEKIREKNVSLEEERKRRAEAEEKEHEAQMKREEGALKNQKAQLGREAAALGNQKARREKAAEEKSKEEASQGIHPSRLAQIGSR
ncbi:hypothetical protein LTR78_005872 [Recurvomyces mirabilis]|uniref:RRM domain-containing protein n=1 Tax=Recurvomyces mirabilis TaxID=574656 RepID=A0AAE0WMI0_9PEZI|nr:hypothetical protein LTR78_005872 [Recurvomyces mirabilis]KAK5154253.1 hypothetical protein LTS14_006938 [Recurvomyces mirabilis]